MFVIQIPTVVKKGLILSFEPSFPHLQEDGDSHEVETSKDQVAVQKVDPQKPVQNKLKQMKFFIQNYNEWCVFAVSR